MNAVQALQGLRKEEWRQVDLSALDVSRYHTVPSRLAVRMPKDLVSFPENAPVQHAQEALKRLQSRVAGEYRNPFSLAARSVIDPATCFWLGEDASPKEPLKLSARLLHESPSPAMGFARIKIVLEANAELTIIIQPDEHGESAHWVHWVWDAQLGPKARLRIFCEGPALAQSLLLTDGRVWCDENAQFSWKSLETGGHTVRHELRVALEGEKSSCETDGMFIGSNNEKSHGFFIVTHNAPTTKSRQSFQSVLSDQAMYDCQSLVHVTREGKGSYTRQMNRNWILADGARALSRPQLRIDTDEVDCRHGAATGRMEEDECFYLRTRGFGSKQARALIAQGIVDHYVQDIPFSDLKETWARRAYAKIEQLLPSEIRA